LRKDFFDVYRALLGKGFLLSIFTNATLVTEEHVRFFKKFPPRDIEVTVYGVTKETYERVTRTPGSFDAFLRGLDLLLRSGAHVRLKAMALRSNKHEIAAIGEFCRARTKDYYRFDPHLHLRFDRDEVRNSLILAERLTPKEVARLPLVPGPRLPRDGGARPARRGLLPHRPRPGGGA
jgi:MoaA/NifB/PqqE/SkfB family radical SAM enzyme